MLSSRCCPDRVAKLFAVWLLAMALAAGVYAPGANADVYVRTVPRQSRWVADGVTEYAVDFIADTTEETGLGFTLAEWSVSIPDGLDYVRAELPDEVNPISQNPEDFFLGHAMDLNWVYSLPVPNGTEGWSLKIPGNVRETLNSTVGPSDVNNKILGSYFFTVNTLAVPRTTNFLSSIEKLRGADNVDYNAAGCLPQFPQWGCLQKDHQPFTIVAPEIAGDLNMDGVVDMDDVPLYVGAVIDPA